MLKAAIALAFALIVFPAVAQAGVSVRDDVAVTGEAVMLAARTGGLIFSRGGEIVAFSVDGTSLGRNLSGGDGWAFREFKPRREKLYKITAASGDETGTGYLLVLRKGKGIIFIDVRGSLFSSAYSRAPMEGSREAVERIMKRHPVVYLQTDIPGVAVRAWLKENGFPEAPLLGWRGGQVFDYIEEKGLKVKAVVGSAEVAESALGHGAKAFTFERTSSEEVYEVGKWEEVEEGMR